MYRTLKAEADAKEKAPPKSMACDMLGRLNTRPCNVGVRYDNSAGPDGHAERPRDTSAQQLIGAGETSQDRCVIALDLNRDWADDSYQ